MTNDVLAGPAPPLRLHHSAVGFAVRGWRVLPLHTPCDGGCSCGTPGCTSPGKHPRTRHGVNAATTRREIIAAWWRRWPDANVGVATGGSLVVLDVDGERGRHSLDGRAVPVTPVVETGHGWHHYFWAPWPQLSRIGLLPGVDVRGEGGYVVAPPSLHATGRLYATVSCLGFDQVEMAVAPDWLLGAADSSRAARPPGHWRSVLRDGVAVGARNATLASIAGHLLRRGVDGAVVLELLAVWNQARCSPPLPAREVEQTVRSIARAEMRRRELLR